MTDETDEFMNLVMGVFGNSRGWLKTGSRLVPTELLGCLEAN